MPDPVQNALAAQPSNNLAYIGPTPRNRFMGGIADLLALGYKLPNMPRMGVPGLDFMAANRNRLLDMLGVGDVQKTAEALSYGNRIGTGAGITYRPLPETLGAAMTVAPMVAPAARMVGKGAMETGRAGERLAERVVPQIMERGGLPAEMLGAMGNRTISPLDVYHGTPHTLPPTPNNPLGEFDASKIGTGEGAQSYGHGIYTAENPAVAQKYKEQLGTQMQYKGQQFYDPIVGRKTATTGNTEIDDYLLSYLGDTGVVRKELLNAAKEMRASKNPQALKEYQTLMAEFRKIRPDVTAANTGNLYKVDLPDEKIAQMIDYDKPMAEQRNVIEKMRKALVGPDSPLSRSEQFQINDYLNDNVRMRNLHPQLVVDLNDPRIVERLRQAGIPGIKYFDEGSRNLANTYIVRNPQGGENVFSSKTAAEAYVKKYPEDKLIEPKVTRNFVVFPGEEKSMTILERNGQPAQMSVADQIDNINEVLKKKRKK
jgi:hypothetical protein